MVGPATLGQAGEVVSKVSFPWVEGGEDARDVALVTDFIADLASVTDELGTDNFREEGIRRRSIDPAEPPWDVIGATTYSTGPVAVLAQAWGPIPVGLGFVLQHLPDVVVAPGEIVRFSGSVDFPTTVIGPTYGIPGGTLAELRIGGTLEAAPWNDEFSEVWLRTVIGLFNVGTGLSCFATYKNTTGSDKTFQLVQIELQCDGTVRVGDGVLLLERFRGA